MTAAEELFEQIKALSPPDKLRLAASLLEARKPEMAHKIADIVVTELGAAIALRSVQDTERKETP